MLTIPRRTRVSGRGRRVVMAGVSVLMLAMGTAVADDFKLDKSEWVGANTARYTFFLLPDKSIRQQFPTTSGASAGGDQSNRECGQLSSDADHWFYRAKTTVPCRDEFSFVVPMPDGSMPVYEFVINVVAVLPP